MSQDRMVQFTEDNKPTLQEVEKVLKNFLGGVGEVSYNVDRFIVCLPGTPTQPFTGFPNCLEIPSPETRWIEVWYGEDPKYRDSLDIMTRNQDEFTNALAECLATIFARFWNGDYLS